MRSDYFFAILLGVQEEEKTEHTTPQVPSLEKEGRGRTTPALGDLGTPFAKGDLPSFSAWQLAWELGYTIAIPIVLLALLGRWADKMLGTSPWMLLVGVLVSIVISSFLVYHKVKDVIRKY